MKSVLASFLIAYTIACTVALTPAQSKEWTIWARQQELMKQVNAGQKSKELTAKEAKRLRGDLSDVARKKKSFRNDDKTPMTDEEKKAVEKKLNDVSLEINKLKLEKRVEVKSK